MHSQVYVLAVKPLFEAKGGLYCTVLSVSVLAISLLTGAAAVRLM